MKTVIEMASYAGFKEHNGMVYVTTINADCAKELERFAELVRADEREACSGKVEVFARKWWSIHCGTNKHRDTTRKAHDDFCMLQAMIRARSNT